MSSEKAGNTEEEFYGFYEGLSAGHLPFAVIDETSLIGDLSGYDLLILPNVTCLNREATSNIRQFVGNGGNIISSFETSRYTENGKKLENFELSDVFGTENTGEIFGPLRWDYISTSDKDHFSLHNVKNDFLNAPAYGIRLKAKGVTPMMFCQPLPGSYSGSPELSSFPFVIDNSFGRGKSVYMAGTFGGSLHRYHFPEYYTILSNLVGSLSQPVIKCTDTPSSVEVVIRRKGNAVFLYLINFTSGMRRPIQRIIPCNDLGIEVFTGEKVRNVRGLWSGKNHAFSSGKGSVSFTIPVLENYEVVQIDL